MNSIVEMYEEEIRNIAEELSKEPYDSEKYQRLMARLSDLQKLLNQETSREIILQKAELEDQRIDLEHQKLEIERENLEVENERNKIEKRKPVWQIAGTVVAAVTGAAVFVFEMLGVITANNSGETLPQAFTKRIGSRF